MSSATKKILREQYQKEMLKKSGFFTPKINKIDWILKQLQGGI